MAKDQSTQQSVLFQADQLSWSVADQLVLDNLNFSLPSNRFIGILGPNGAGKSTLLRCLYRYLKPTLGQVTFNGENIWQTNAKSFSQQVAVVLQHTPQDFNLSVFDVVAQGQIPHNSWWSALQANNNQPIFDAIEKVGLSHKTQQNFDSLSGGEKQRVMIARAIVQQPKVLIMDEPTSHLDVKYQIQIMELTKSLGISVIATFHDLNLASAICDHLLLIKRGRLIGQGEPEQVLTEQNLSNVFDVCCEITPHPQHKSPHVTYFYGYVTQGDVSHHE